MSSATATPKGLTWEGFLDLPGEPRFKHAELLDGELILANPLSWLHQHAVGELHALLRNWVRAVISARWCVGHRTGGWLPIP
jgi:Uma2 family endonuclease